MFFTVPLSGCEFLNQPLKTFPLAHLNWQFIDSSILPCLKNPINWSPLLILKVPMFINYITFSMSQIIGKLPLILLVSCLVSISTLTLLFAQMKWSYVYITIWVSNFTFSKIVVIKSTRKLSFIFMFADKMSLSMFFVLCPTTRINLLWRLILSIPLFYVIDPLTTIKVVLIVIVVYSWSVFLSVPKISLIYYRKLTISCFLEKYFSITMNLSVRKFSFIHNVASFKIVCSFSVK